MTTARVKNAAQEIQFLPRHEMLLYWYAKHDPDKQDEPSEEITERKAKAD